MDIRLFSPGGGGGGGVDFFFGGGGSSHDPNWEEFQTCTQHIVDGSEIR